MKLSIPRERHSLETRTCITPEVVKKLNNLGVSVHVESGVGLKSNISDDSFKEAGAVVENSLKSLFEKTDAIMLVRLPEEGSEIVKAMPQNAKLIGLLAPKVNKEKFAPLIQKKVSAVSLDQVPRITRAQAMDVLSSQSNLAGYKAVIEGASAFDRALPMMMTAAGTVFPANVLVLGAGVAGLQAIATAKRLGAVVSAFDVRPAAKEQVESLGGKFIEVESNQTAETRGGYAKEMDEDYKKRQAEKIKEALIKADIVITTALIPGKPAPKLITAEMLPLMKDGSVIVDLAAEMGGNTQGCEKDKTVIVNGVKIIGHTNLAGMLAGSATSLLARNYFSFIEMFYDKETKILNLEKGDEIIKGTLVLDEGKFIEEGV